MDASTLIIVVIQLLLFERGRCDLCDICRRQRDSSIRLPYNQRWYYDPSLFLCQPFNFCDDEITEHFKSRKSKNEINCGGVDCFDWLYESLKKRRAQESDLPKTLLSHHSYHPHYETTPPKPQHPTAADSYQHYAYHETTTIQPTPTVRTILREPATSQDDSVGEREPPFEFGLGKPEAIHISLVPKNSAHRKPEICTLKPDRGRRWPCSQRWYYSLVENTCKTFTFCGKKGNKNNFLTNETCYEQCHHDSTRERHGS
ncbi:uncharacterized protein LOC144174326 isoform X2 [Haemaphysalis longicornis]